MCARVARKIALNTFFSVTARVIGIFISLFTVALITRYLGKDGYGDYSILISFFYGFSVLADLGLYSILVREISRPDADEKKILSGIFTLRLLAAVLFFSIGSALIFFLPYSDAVKKIGFLMAASYIFISLNQLFVAVFQKYLKLIRVSLAEVASRLFQLILLFSLFKSGLKFGAAISIFFLTNFLNFLLVYFFTKQLVKFKIDFDFSFFKKILKESIPLAISLIFIYVYFRADSFILSLFKPAEHVGIYSLAYRILENIIFLPAVFVGLVMPHLSHSAFNDFGRFERIIQKSLDALNFLSVPIIFGTIIIAPQIINLIGGNNFLESVAPLRILIVSIFFIFGATLLGNALVALNKQRDLMKLYGLAAALSLVMNLFLIPRYSYFGTAITTIATEATVFLGMILIIKKYFKIKIYFNSAIKAIFSSIMMAFVIFYFKPDNVFISVVLGTVSYIAFLFLFKGIKKEDFKLIFGK